MRTWTSGERGGDHSTMSIIPYSETVVINVSLHDFLIFFQFTYIQLYTICNRLFPTLKWGKDHVGNGIF